MHIKYIIHLTSGKNISIEDEREISILADEVEAAIDWIFFDVGDGRMIGIVPSHIIGIEECRISSTSSGVVKGLI